MLKINNTDVLYKMALPVYTFNHALHELLEKMVKLIIAKELKYITAPQVGIDKQIIVIREFDKDGNPLILTIMNPMYAKKEGWQYSQETCNSFPNYVKDKVRFKQIKISYYDADGKITSVTRTGTYAALIQHCMDHIRGVCIKEELHAGFGDYCCASGKRCNNAERITYAESMLEDRKHRRRRLQ